MQQGWLLVILTSITTILGCCVIYTDQVYRLLFPKRYVKHPFSIAHDTNFLICSLSLSAGCLTLTSFYKLLPNSWKYLHKASNLQQNGHLAKATLFTFFFLGVLCCNLLNFVIHFLTNESVVHCVHEGADGDEHSHDEPHTHVHTHSHQEESEHTSSHDDELYYHKQRRSPETNGSITLNEVASEQASALSVPIVNPHEHTPLLLDSNHNRSHNSLLPKKRISLVDISLKAIRGETPEGDCLGDMNDCNPVIVCQHQLQSPNELHFCSIPSTENLLFIDNDKRQLITKKSQICKRFPELEVSSPLIHNSPKKPKNSAVVQLNQIEYNSTTDEDDSRSSSQQRVELNELSTALLLDKSISNHRHLHGPSPTDLEVNGDSLHEHHHHHIQTPLSRLLSIGLQTILAITLHKFPEGFIMYSTSQADPSLGLSIFLSMFIHNFVEGFTMTLPLYVALDSRWKAILISGSLGALAQPVGALVGWVFFRGSFDLTLDSNLILIGALIALTSGFLSYISFQMFASAIGFGGKQEKVVKWMFFGIFLIGLSEVLVGKK